MLAEQAKHAEKRKRFLADSISNISHQLKTPITSMFVMTDPIQDENLPQDKRTEFTMKYKVPATGCSGLLHQAAETFKIDAGTIDFKKEKVNVREPSTDL